MRDVKPKRGRPASMLMSAGQCRAARGFLGWSQDALARAAGVSRAMVADFESGKREAIFPTRNALQDALEEAGVLFPPREDGAASIVFPDEPSEPSR